MSLLLRCEDVTRLATEHLEGGLPPGLGLRVRAHLGLCRACRAFLDSLRVLPRLMGSSAGLPAGAADLETPACRQQRAALAGALRHLAAPGPRHPPTPAHPAPGGVLEAAAQPGADRTLAFMARAYRHLQAAGPVDAEPYLPEPLLAELPPPAAWTWRQALLQGCRAAELLRDPGTGSRLFLLVLPPGRRFPDHVHRAGEDFLVLHGHAEDAVHYAGPGDWLRQDAASEHRNLEGRVEACWGLARVGPEGVELQGWRGALQRLFEGSSA